MSDRLARLKALSRSGEALQRLLRLLMPTHRLKRERVTTALHSVGNADLAHTIMNCGRGRLCGSSYCKHCRRRMWLSLHERVWERVNVRHGGDEQSANAGLRWLTILNDLTPLDERAVAKAMKEARKVLTAMRRKFPGLWMQGAFELELINLSLLRTYSENTTKRDTLAAMLGDHAGTMRIAVLVHFHVIMDVSEVDEDELKSWIIKRWSQHPNQTKCQRLRTDRTFVKNIRKLTSYPFKDAMSYKLTFEGYNNVEFGDEKSFTNDELGFLVTLYDRTGGNGWTNLLIKRG